MYLLSGSIVRLYYKSDCAWPNVTFFSWTSNLLSYIKLLCWVNNMSLIDPLTSERLIRVQLTGRLIVICSCFKWTYSCYFECPFMSEDELTSSVKFIAVFWENYNSILTTYEILTGLLFWSTISNKYGGLVANIKCTSRFLLV